MKKIFLLAALVISTNSFAANNQFSFMKANFDDNIQQLKEKGFTCSETECSQESFDLSVSVTFNSDTKRVDTINFNEAFVDKNSCRTQLKLFSYVINDKYGFSGYNPDSNRATESGAFFIDGEKIGFKSTCDKVKGDTPAMSGFRLGVSFNNTNSGNAKVDDRVEKQKVYRFFD